ncbi:MAG: GntR family transcriptional regulator [Thermaerobacter sp.]|nr:GntR family transcriptional regulator [Thermaerobacter sp.]
MLLYVDLADRRPVYQQLRDQVVEAIARGDIGEGTRLPTTRQLAADLAVNFHTVSRAYDLLRQEGFIQVSRKSGAAVYVSGKAAPPEWRASLRTQLAEAYAKDMPRDDILDVCKEILAGFGQREPHRGSSLA